MFITVNSIHKKRLYLLLFALLCLFSVTGLVLYALSQNINLFYTPTELLNGQAPKEQVIRIGGLVVPGSHKQQGLNVKFAITDTVSTITIKYNGILPDLFREGQGIVVTGKYTQNIFEAEQVLARHDENYMPPEVPQAMKAQFQSLMREQHDS